MKPNKSQSVRSFHARCANSVLQGLKRCENSLSKDKCLSLLGSGGQWWSCTCVSSLGDIFCFMKEYLPARAVAPGHLVLKTQGSVCRPSTPPPCTKRWEHMKMLTCPAARGWDWDPMLWNKQIREMISWFPKVRQGGHRSVPTTGPSTSTMIPGAKKKMPFVHPFPRTCPTWRSYSYVQKWALWKVAGPAGGMILNRE